MICKLKSLSDDTLIETDYLKQMATKKIYLQWYFRIICLFNLVGILFGVVSFYSDFSAKSFVLIFIILFIFILSRSYVGFWLSITGLNIAYGWFVWNLGEIGLDDIKEIDFCDGFSIKFKFDNGKTEFFLLCPNKIYNEILNSRCDANVHRC